MSDQQCAECGSIACWLYDVTNKCLCDSCYAKQRSVTIGWKEIPHCELMAFYETIPESMRVHLTESQVEEEYRHHYGKP